MGGGNRRRANINRANRSPLPRSVFTDCCLCVLLRKRLDRAHVATDNDCSLLREGLSFVEKKLLSQNQLITERHCDLTLKKKY